MICMINLRILYLFQAAARDTRASFQRKLSANKPTFITFLNCKRIVLSCLFTARSP